MEKIKQITAAAALILLAGCGTPVSEEPAPTALPATATASAEPVTITNQVDFNVLEETADLSGYKWLNDPEPAFREISLQESIRFFSEGGSGILVYTADTCPFCNRAVPILNEVLKEKGVKAYLVDTNMPIASDQLTSMKLYNELCSYIDSIFELAANGQPMFQIPEVIAVKDGGIVGHHLSLVDSFVITDENSQLNEEEKEQMRNIYRDLIDACAD